MKTKFKEGDRIKVCNKLETTIERIQWVEMFKEYRYWFKDDEGILWNETEKEIKLISHSKPTKKGANDELDELSNIFQTVVILE